MSELRRTWPSDAVDAIAIVAPGGEITIEGTDGDQIELEGEFGKRRLRGPYLEPIGRWLQLQLWGHHGEGDFTLSLPKKKAWVVDLSVGHGEVQINDIQARLRVMLGHGEIHVEDCRGVFNVASGHGEVELIRCTEAEMPERPPLPQAESVFQTPPEPVVPPVPPVPPAPEAAEPGVRVRKRMRREHRRDWGDMDAEDWAEWGAELGERASAWAEQFAGNVANHMLNEMDWIQEKSGVNVKKAAGEVRLEDLQASSVAIEMGNGELELEGGRIEKLDVDLAHGEFESDSVLPAGDWSIELRHGDIQLALPSDTRARLDVATRHGDIESEVPLVRVGRPGREARHGGRMVGTVGSADGQVAQINMSTLHGDIQIEWVESASDYAEPPVSSRERVTTAEPRAERSGAAAQASDQAVSASASRTPIYDSQLAVLNALSQGQISVADAENLLRSLER